MLGPLSSARVARQVADAIESAVPLRRCTTRVRLGRPQHDGTSAASQLGVAACPSAAPTDAAADHYRLVTARLLRGLLHEPELLFEPLRAQLARLASREQFEQAADVHDRAAALAAALRRQQRLDQLRRSGRVELALPGGAGAELDGGRLVRGWGTGQLDLGTRLAVGPSDDADPEQPASPTVAAEVLAVASWLDANAHRVRVVHADAPLSSPSTRLPSFAARA